MKMWSIAHEVGHAFRSIHQLDTKRARSSRRSAKRLRAIYSTLAVALVGFGVLALTGHIIGGYIVFVAAACVLSVALGLEQLRHTGVTRPDEQATDALAATWGYPLPMPRQPS